jgi:hypothetical protein
LLIDPSLRALFYGNSQGGWCLTHVGREGAEWKLGGFQRMLGRRPELDDPIVPSREGRHRRVWLGLTRFHEDLERIGLRKRRQSDTRRTLISLAIADGARKDVLRWITHGSSGDVIDGYTTLPWEQAARGPWGVQDGHTGLGTGASKSSELLRERVGRTGFGKR